MNQRQPRIRDSKYLEWIRRRPCCVTGLTPVDAAHIRYGSLWYGKRSTGMGEKPDDKWAVPLHRTIHTEQHSMNEQVFWQAKGIDPLAVAQNLYAEYGGNDGKVRAIRRPRKKMPSRKIQSRPFQNLTK